MSATNDSGLALAALQKAVGTRRCPTGLVHHTDRGSPFASGDHSRALASHGIVASMSRKADGWDNVVAESFFATLRAELVDHERIPTRAERIIGPNIESFYNTTRLHSHLGNVSLVEFELRSQLTRSAA